MKGETKMVYNKIVCLYFDNKEKNFFHDSFLQIECDVQLIFTSSLDELTKLIDKDSFIILSVRFADKNIKKIKQLFEDHSHFIYNFYHYDSINALPLDVLDLLFDYPQQITKPESSIFLMEQFKAQLQGD